jgi:glycosyltransferase involved in cell wall biosynthesis
VDAPTLQPNGRDTVPAPLNLADNAMVSVLHATAWYAPKYLGGTEVYVSGLARELRAIGIGARVVTSCDPGEAETSELEGIPVRRYPTEPADWRVKLRGEPSQLGFRQFCDVLLEEPTSIYHQHSWDIALGAHHLRAAREAGLKTVLTVHTAWNICMRGTMVKFGRETCDGRIDPSVCAACWMQKHGLPPAIGRPLAAIPPGVSRCIGSQIPEKHVACAVFGRALGERHKNDFSAMVANADRIVAISGWLMEALKLNGVPAAKLVLCRNGVDPAFANNVTKAPRPNGAPFRLLYLGRWDPRKGVHVLVSAVRALPSETPVELTIHGVGEGAEEGDYADEVRRLAGDDRRIDFRLPVPRSQLLNTLSKADALAIPSLLLETGPLVALEAQAAGVRVLGSRLGGIAEIIQEPEDGVLVPAGDITAWTEAIRRLASEDARTSQAPYRRLRTMREVANDMAALYQSLS